MNELARIRRNALHTEELKNGKLGLWWLSFSDPRTAKGLRFLGVVIVEAYGFIDPLKKTQDLGVNPGGEVQWIAFPPDEDAPEAMRNRLLQKPELDQLG